MSKQISLNVFTMNCVGHLNGGLWRHPLDQAHRYTDQNYWVELALTAERGKLDAIFLADVLGMYDVYQGSADASLREAMQTPVNDPLLIIPTMAYVTKHLGFAATHSTSYIQPFILARKFSTLDHLTKGRIAWNIVTSYLPHAAKNLGQTGLTSHDERYEKADEYLEVLYKLWESSWESDAVIRDKERGIYTDPSKVHEINHKGKYFDVPGPFVCEPSTQRTPVLYQAGQSSKGRDFAAKHAEAVFTVYPTKELVKEYIQDMRKRAQSYGRNPDDIKIFPGFVPIVGATEDVAFAKYESYKKLVSYDAALAHTSGALGVDFSKFEPKQVIRDIESEGVQGILEVFTRSSPDYASDGAGWTLEDVSKTAALGSFMPVVVGTPEQVADWIEDWQALGADGFNIGELVHSETVRDFVDIVVPVLQKRGLFRTEYKYDNLRSRLLQRDQPYLPDTHPARSIVKEVV